MNRLFRDPLINNVGTMALLSFVQALQLLILTAVVLSFISIPTTSFAQKIFPVYLPEVRPEREMLLYRLFVLAALALQAVWVFMFRRRLNERDLWKIFVPYVTLTGMGIFVQLFAIFKIFVWGDPTWARVLLYGSLVGAGLMQLFYPELKRYGQKFYGRWDKTQPQMFGRPWIWDIAFVALVPFLLWPLHLDYVLGRIFVRDQFYHLDGFLMAPAWAHLKGLLLNKDVISQYGIAMPIFVGEWVKHLGGFDYASVVRWIMAWVLCYYVALYFLISHWLGRRTLAAFGVLLAVKLQMFHWGVAPLAWQFPTALAIRHWPDVIFFLFLWKHIKTGQQNWLWALAMVSGFTLVWMIDVGTYLLVAFMFYVGSFLFYKRLEFPDVIKTLSIVLLLTAATAFGALLLLQPSTVFLPEFWHNAFEHAGLFMQGWGALPMTDGLKDKQFFAFIVGFLIPVVYAWTMIYLGTLIYFKRVEFDRMFTVVICMYGLGLYHYFIHRSGVTSYYAVCIPLVLVICFWLNQVAVTFLRDTFSLKVRRLGEGVLVFSTLCALMTSYLFTYYPNIFNLGGLDWKTEANFYKAHFDFKTDADLINIWTKPNEPAAVISSFETKMLLQADRAPFFYYSPLIESSLMDAYEQRNTYLLTFSRLHKTLAQLEQRRPAFIFVEERLMARNDGVALGGLLDYVRAHYQPEVKGQYLRMYKRKD